MDIKQREVDQWLESLYGPENVLEYERTEDNINLLHTLMGNNIRAEKMFNISIQDYQRKTQEYVAQGEQLSQAFDSVGLQKLGLSSEGQEALRNITDAACTVDAATATEADIIVAFNRLEALHDKVTQKSNSNLHLRSQLVECSQILANKIQHAKRLEQQAEVTTGLEQKELNSNSRKTLFHTRKLAEYQAEIIKKQSTLRHRGHSDDVTHQTVLDKHLTLQQLQTQESSLKTQLEAYSLPPDVAAVRLAIEEAKLKLDNLMTDMAKQHT